jgi:hypothetical protein
VQEGSGSFAGIPINLSGWSSADLFVVRVRAECPEDQPGDEPAQDRPGLRVLSARSLALATGQLLDTWSGLRHYSSAPPGITVQYGPSLRVGLVSVAQPDDASVAPESGAFIEIPLALGDSVRIWLPEDPGGLLGNPRPLGNEVIRYLHRSAREGFR